MKFSKKTLTFLVLVAVGLVLLPLSSWLAQRRVNLEQRATGGTGVMAMRLAGPEGKVSFAPSQSVAVRVISSLKNSQTQRVYAFGIRLSVSGASINSQTYKCASPFKELVVRSGEWGLVCYKEGGVLVADGQELANFTILTGESTGDGSVSFVDLSVAGLDGALTAGVADLTGSRQASTNLSFSIGLPKFSSKPFSQTVSGITPTPGVNKCYYQVNVDWGPDQAGVALTQKVMRGDTVILPEQVWCGAEGTYPAGIPKMTSTTGSCAGWGSPKSNVRADLGSVAYYKLYYNGVAVTSQQVVQQVDTGTFCASLVTPTPTVSVPGCTSSAARPAKSWCSNANISYTVETAPSTVDSWESCQEWCLAHMGADDPICQYNGGNACWTKSAPTSGCVWEVSNTGFPKGDYYYYRNSCSEVAPTSTVIQTQCLNGELGNLNCSTDGRIDSYDLYIMLGAYAPEGPVPVPAAGQHTADIAPTVPDGLVDGADVAKLLDNGIW